MIKVLLFDVDGVLTDGKKYISEQLIEIKSLSLKDIDTFSLLNAKGYKLGCITGENTAFSRQFMKMSVLDYVKIGCKQKEYALKEAEEKFQVTADEICYIGDGKYDIPVLKKVGLAVCPNDAIEEVKKVSDIVLKHKGGEGCIAEVYDLLIQRENRMMVVDEERNDINRTFIEQMTEHGNILTAIAEDTEYFNNINVAIEMIIESYRENRHLFLCGNGGSAADAQHLAAELVGKFYLERRALSAEALTANTSILTSLANDYDYNMVFARQLEAKAIEGDILIGITTSGTSENILWAFQEAKKLKIKTILMTGKISEFTPILTYTDCLLAVPSLNTPRIQEMHILTGHIICEVVERELTNK